MTVNNFFDEFYKYINFNTSNKLTWSKNELLRFADAYGRKLITNFKKDNKELERKLNLTQKAVDKGIEEIDKLMDRIIHEED